MPTAPKYPSRQSGPRSVPLIARRALIALAVFLSAVVLFISWRLEFKMALAGLAALLHDLLITVGVYSLTGFPVTPATVVAVLVILGYSLYDTVVVFDKVEELVEIEEQKTYSEIVNQAMNAVLSRSLATSLTSLLPVGEHSVCRIFHTRGPDSSRLRFGSLRRYRRRHLLLDLCGCTSIGDLERTRGGVARPRRMGESSHKVGPPLIRS